MPKITRQKDGITYEQVDPASLYESDIEECLLIHAKVLFPDYYVRLFKVTIESSDGDKAQPDLIFISKNYDDWWIVEVEMINHPLDSHVIRQMRVFYDGIYNERIVQYINKKLDELDISHNLNLVRNLIINHPPQLLIITNNIPEAKWHDELTRYKVKISIFSIYRSNYEDEVFSLSGFFIPNGLSH
jgi:hypothetical protein